MNQQGERWSMLPFSSLLFSPQGYRGDYLQKQHIYRAKGSIFLPQSKILLDLVYLSKHLQNSAAPTKNSLKLCSSRANLTLAYSVEVPMAHLISQSDRLIRNALAPLASLIPPSCPSCLYISSFLFPH